MSETFDVTLNVDNYRQHLLANGFAESSTVQYVCQATRFVNYVNEHGLAYDLSSVEKFAIEHKRSTPAGQNTLLRQLKRFFEWLWSEGVIDERLLRNFPKSPRTSTRIPKIIDDVSFDLMLANTPERHHLTLMLMYYLGLRENELLELRWEDFNFTNKTFKIKRKGGFYQELPYTEPAELEEQVHKCAKANGFVVVGKFAESDEVRMSASGLYKLIQYVSTKAGLEGIHPHALRHSFACDAMTRGVDMSTIQHTLGHKSLNTTLGYLRGIQSNVETIRNGLKRGR